MTNFCVACDRCCNWYLEEIDCNKTKAKPYSFHIFILPTSTLSEHLDRMGRFFTCTQVQTFSTVRRCPRAAKSKVKNLFQILLQFTYNWGRGQNFLFLAFSKVSLEQFLSQTKLWFWYTRENIYIISEGGMKFF